jgi:predicted permease
VVWRSIVGDYFGTMGIRLLRGRLFTSSDTHDAQPVVVINATMARHYWPNADPIGQRIKLGNGTKRDWATIVGIVGDVRFNAPDTPAGDEAYRPNSQQSLVFMHYVLRTRGDPLSLQRAMHDAVRSLDSTVPIAEVRALGALFDASNATRRTVSVLLVTFALLGLALGAIGIYGVISYGVVQRTRELGIRRALGANESGIVMMVLRGGARMAGLGIVIGALVATLAARSLQSLVFGVTTADPIIYASVASALALVALAASTIPAWRASRVDPLVALRSD